MARSLNKVILIGNIGNDPEIRSVNAGSKVASFNLATSRTWNDQSGTKQEKTEWHKCIVWNALADVVERYVKKGEKLYVEGEIQYRQWTDKEGQTRYTTEINVRELILLGGRSGGSDSEGAPRRAAAPARSAKAAPAASGAASSNDDFSDFPAALDDDDDDLPF